MRKDVQTGKVFSYMFFRYNKKQFLESVNLFYKRFKINDLNLDWFKNKK